MYVSVCNKIVYCKGIDTSPYIIKHSLLSQLYSEIIVFYEAFFLSIEQLSLTFIANT